MIESAELIALARQFAEGEIRPNSADWDEARELPGEIVSTVAEMGFMGLLIPEQYEGLGLDAALYVAVLEELARADGALALTVAVHNGPAAETIRFHGSDEMKADLLPRMASGDVVGAVALTEPGASGDLARISTTACEVHGGWALSGVKSWVTNGGRADRILVYARLGHDEVGCFVVDPSSSGYSVESRADTMGFKASETVTVRMEDVAIGPDALVSRGHAHASLADPGRPIARLGGSAIAVGIGQAALDHAVEYAREREQFGRPIAHFGAIKTKFGEMSACLSAARALTREAAEAYAHESDPGSPELAAKVAAAKSVASQASILVTDEAVQIFGGYGYMRDYPVEKLMRDAHGMEIYEGNSEVMRTIVARELLSDDAS